jgi:hypothetical protein
MLVQEIVGLVNGGDSNPPYIPDKGRSLSMQIVKAPILVQQMIAAGCRPAQRSINAGPCCLRATKVNLEEGISKHCNCRLTTDLC